MLIDEIVKFCDRQYTLYGGMCGQKDGCCTHPSGSCSGSCYNCLYQIHFPSRAINCPKIKYDCLKMLYHYVCQYSYLYSTELFCAFDQEREFIKNFQYFHVLSLGCGGCADLMAFENLLIKMEATQKVSYIGIDVNKMWQPIHKRINNYCKNNRINFCARYYDVFDCFKENGIADTNIIVLSYLISYLYNTKQIEIIDSLIYDIIENIIKRKKYGHPLLLIINDVNSNKRGRNYFVQFEKAISGANLSIINKTYRYFETGNLNDFQRIGEPYNVFNCIYEIPVEIINKYHAQSNVNATIQLIIEVN